MTLEIAPNVRVRVERAEIKGLSSYGKGPSKKDKGRLAGGLRAGFVNGGVMVEASSQNPIPIAVLLTLAALFLYLHFSNGSGFIRLMLAVALVVASVILLLPSFKLPLPGYFDAMPKIQLGLDLQGGTHLLLEVKLQDAVNNALKRRGDDLSHAMTDSKLDPPGITQNPDGSVVVKLKKSGRSHGIFESDG